MRYAVAAVLLVSCADFDFRRAAKAFAATRRQESYAPPPSYQQADDGCSQQTNCQWLGSQYICDDACGRRVKTCQQFGQQWQCRAGY